MESKIVITIKTDNAAFCPDPAPEVARILREAIARLQRSPDGFTLRDVNGNTVGTVEVWD